MGSNYCIMCGKEIPEGDIVCAYCKEDNSPTEEFIATILGVGEIIIRGKKNDE